MTPHEQQVEENRARFRGYGRRLLAEFRSWPRIFAAALLVGPGLMLIQRRFDQPWEFAATVAWLLFGVILLKPFLRGES